MASGRIEGVTALTQGAVRWSPTTARFCEARFELEDRSVQNAVRRTQLGVGRQPVCRHQQLNGLKIVVMLLSNWDTKDRRDVSRGSNTAIFEYAVGRVATRSALSDHRLGRRDGKWGRPSCSRDRWDVAGFEAQTPQFVAASTTSVVDFGYQGQRSEIGRAFR